MTTKTVLKEQIYNIIESLSVEHLNKLLQFLKERLPADNQPATIAPIYQLHLQAIDTGIPDLAENAEIDLSSSKIYCAIAKSLLFEVRTQARKQGVSTETLINLWLQEKLSVLS